MRSENLRVSVDGTKYTYVFYDDGSAEALRYGEPWIDSFTDIPGSNMILAMAHELSEARKEIELRKLEDVKSHDL